MSDAEYLRRLIRASIEAARDKLHETSSEAELRMLGSKALGLLLKAVKPPAEIDESGLQDVLAAVGAYTLLEAYVMYFPNTEKIVECMETGDQIFQKMIGLYYASPQAPRSSDSEED